MRKIILSGFMSSLLLVSVIAYSLPAFAQGPVSSDHSQVEYAFGKIIGTDIIIHVAVIVPPGLDKNDVIDQALNYQGAKKIEKSEFTTIGGLNWSTWNAGIANIKYNSQNEPVDSFGSFTNAIGTWNDVEPNFQFQSGTTTVCPSLVRECGGVADSENGFGWVKINQPQTLGVTYYDTSAHEIDVALTTNNKISWTKYDVETVTLHELGHALGLGHSEVKEAVMYPSYHGLMRTLHPDDICGVEELYGTPCSPDSVTPDPGTTSCPTPNDTSLVVDILMDTQTKGRFTDLLIPVTVTDGTNPKSGVCVDVDLVRDGASWDFMGTTDDSGKIIFKLGKARDVVYTATIVNQDHFKGQDSQYTVSCLNTGGSLSGLECRTP